MERVSALVLALVRRGAIPYVQEDVIQVVWDHVKTTVNILALETVQDLVVALVWEVVVGGAVVQALMVQVAEIVMEDAKILVQVVVNNHVKMAVRNAVQQHVKGLAVLLVQENVIKAARVVVILGAVRHVILDAKELVQGGVLELVMQDVRLALEAVLGVVGLHVLVLVLV